MAFPSCVISNHGPTMTRRDENPCPDGRKNYFPSDMGESFTIVGKVGWKSFESLAVEPTFDIFFMTKIKLYEVLLFFFWNWTRVGHKLANFWDPFGSLVFSSVVGRLLVQSKIKHQCVGYRWSCFSPKKFGWFPTLDPHSSPFWDPLMIFGVFPTLTTVQLEFPLTATLKQNKLDSIWPVDKLQEAGHFRMLRMPLECVGHEHVYCFGSGSSRSCCCRRLYFLFQVWNFRLLWPAK